MRINLSDCHDFIICIACLIDFSTSTAEIFHILASYTHVHMQIERDYLFPVVRTLPSFHINYKTKGHQTRFFKTESSFVEHRCRRTNGDLIRKSEVPVASDEIKWVLLSPLTRPRCIYLQVQDYPIYRRNKYNIL